MTRLIGKKEIERMFAAAAERIRSEESRLSALDSVAGDGDHGATMVRIAMRLEAAAAENRTLPQILQEAGWTVMNVDGGASSAIIGTFFSGMAESCQAETLDCTGFAKACEAGLKAVRKFTAAKPGDKTLLDALVPAVSELSAAAKRGDDVSTGLRSAAEAARAGAEATRDLPARQGRARYRGEMTVGYPDPGATSIALLFDGFCAALHS
jgi:phosphoenolpyruvate---glycerone phosphotransferase subunit DhaL